MYYASFGILSLILHLIINHDALNRKKAKTGSVSTYRYRQYLIATAVYYISDFMWGFLNESLIIPLVYADTIVYFLSMAASVLLWTRYVVAYINKKGVRSQSLLYAGCGIFVFVAVSLVVNFFRPVIFAFEAGKGYVPGTARYLIFGLLFLLYVILTVYSFFYSLRSIGRNSIHYRTVSVSSAVMALFIVFQVIFPMLPYFAVGCLVSTCLIHVFVEVDEKQDMDRKLDNVRKKAELEHEKTERAEKALKESRKEHITFGQIAETLASNYDVIYYVDVADGNYIGYNSRNIFGHLGIDRSGNDFFADVRKNIPLIIHPQDKERILEFLNKDHMLSSLEDRRQVNIEYRLIINDTVQHTRLSVRKSSDSEHFIICVENIDDEIMKEKEHLRALNTEKELARRDELTGIKNKTAFSELEKSVQNNIDNGMDYLPFAIAVCDINDLKKVNDSEGHRAGDEYIKSAAKLLCDIFDHSPVFRIGGDEFVVFLRGDDYSARDDLMLRLRETTMENIISENGPVIASGMSEFVPGEDKDVSQVFERADNLMYADKRQLKLHGS